MAMLLALTTTLVDVTGGIVKDARNMGTMPLLDPFVPRI
jgi:hypothetical protein